MTTRVFFFILLLPLFAAASDFSANVHVSSNKVRVDDELYLTVTLRYPASYIVDRDRMVAQLLERGSLAQPPFAYVSTTVVSKEEKEGRVEEVIRVELDPQVIGNHSLSFFGIPFHAEDQTQRKNIELISPVFSIQIVPAPSDPSYRGVTSPLLTFNTGYPITPSLYNRRSFLDESAADLAAVNQSLWNKKQIPWISIGVVMLFALLIYFVKQKPREETPEQRAFRAEKVALERLERLRDKRLPQNAEFESYYVQLTDTVRQFLEERYGLSAPTQTTREFLASLSEKPFFNEQVQKNLKDFLVRADLVKFARYEPTKDDCAYAEIAAKKVITKTV